MDENICKFMPTLDHNNELVTVNFVRETDWNRTAPVLTATHRICLVINGTGRLTTRFGVFELTEGDLFFTFQAKEFTLEPLEHFGFCYISFMGKRAAELFTRFRITGESPVYHGFSDLIPYWHSALDGATEQNSDLVAESVLYGTLARIPVSPVEGTSVGDTKNAAITVKRYADTHFGDSSLTLGSIAEKFGYNANYISARFLRTVGLSFSVYLTNVRMEYAMRLIRDGVSTVSDLAYACGFSDPLYFSKVFRKKYGITAKEAITAARLKF